MESGLNEHVILKRRLVKMRTQVEEIHQLTHLRPVQSQYLCFLAQNSSSVSVKSLDMIRLVFHGWFASTSAPSRFRTALVRSLKRGFDPAQCVLDPVCIAIAGRLVEVGIVVRGEEGDVTLAESCDSPTQVRLQLKVRRVGIEMLLKRMDLTDHTRNVPDRREAERVTNKTDSTHHLLYRCQRERSNKRIIFLHFTENLSGVL